MTPSNYVEDEALYQRWLHEDDEREQRRQLKQDADQDAAQDRAEGHKP